MNVAVAVLVAAALSAAAAAQRSVARRRMDERAGVVAESFVRDGRSSRDTITARVARLVDATPAWVAAGAVGGWLAGRSIGAVVGAAVGATATRAIKRRRSAATTATLNDQLADAIRSIAAALRAGLSVTQSLSFAADEAEPPIAPSLRRVVDSIGVGAGVDETLHRWAAEIGSDDARLIVGVLGLHRRSGGDLPRILDQVGATLRERRAAEREVRALTAQARLSGAILGLLPIGFFLFLWTTSRRDIAGAFNEPAGIAAVVVGLGLEGIAFIWIRRLLEVR